MVLLDTNELAVRSNNKNMTIEEFYEQSSVNGIKREYMNKK